MYLIDYHTHSLCSFDGCETLSDMAAAAAMAGMGELCLTDHCDLIDEYGQSDRSFSWSPVEEQLSLARPASPLPIRMGLELGEPWEDPSLAAAITAHPELDFVIGSVHNLPLSDGGTDLFHIHYDSAARCHEVLHAYFSCMEALSAMDCYDVLGHVIYPLRYMNDRDGNAVSLSPYFQRLEGIFRAVITAGKGIEVNTCRGQTVEQWREVLGLYKDCGGRIVTLGSDAHKTADIGKGIPEAAALLKEYGFSLALYEKRQPRLISL